MGLGNIPKANETERGLTRARLNQILAAIFGHFIPRTDAGNEANGTADLGAVGKAWRNLYMTGKVFVDGIAQSFGAAAGGSIATGIKSRIAGSYVSSGRRTSGGAPSFLIPQGANGVRIFGSVADPLNITFRDGTKLAITASVDVALTNTRGAAGGANRAQTNIPAGEVSQIASRYFGLRTMGYYGTRMPLTNVGARWTATKDEWIAFSANESGSDYRIGRLITNDLGSWLTDCLGAILGKRGVNADDYVIGAFDAHSANITMELSNINHIFVRKDGTAFAHGKNLFYIANPALDKRTAAAGDIRLNRQEQRWEVAAISEGITTWSELDAVLVGIAVPNATGGCDFARGVFDDAAIKAYAAAPIFTGGRIDPDDATKWQPNFSPHRRRTDIAGLTAGQTPPNDIYEMDPTITAAEFVKYNSPSGAARLSPDWILTQCYELETPVPVNERYDDRHSRPSPVEVAHAFPDDAVGTRRFLYADAEFANAESDTGIPPIMIEAAGRQLFIHPHKTKLALAAGLRAASGGNNIWQFGGIADNEERVVLTGNMAAMRENARRHSNPVMSREVLACGMQTAAAADVFYSVQRGRLQKITLAGEWNTRLPNKSNTPSSPPASGEWEFFVEFGNANPVQALSIVFAPDDAGGNTFAPSAGGRYFITLGNDEPIGNHSPNFFIYSADGGGDYTGAIWHFQYTPGVQTSITRLRIYRVEDIE